MFITPIYHVYTSIPENVKPKVLRLTGGLCGLVVRIPGYRSRGQGSVPFDTSFSEKEWVWNGVNSAS
jgi:hypothetical protein